MRWLPAALAMLLLAGLNFAQIETEGGNVTELNLSGDINATGWDGLFGEAILGAGATYPYTVMGSNVVRLNMVAQEPPCAYSSISMHVIAVNDTALTAPLSAGNLSQLDAFAGGAENGSSTFTLLSTFTLTYGTFSSVPTTYTFANNASSPDFREGYLNDALGNLVFVADVVDDRPDWNGTTSDYQVMLLNNGSPAAYTLWVDVDYECESPGDDEEHRLYIPPIPDYSAAAGEPFDVDAIVRNTGDYNELDIDVYFDCPSGFACGSAAIPRINRAEEGEVALGLLAGPPGTYVLTLHARNGNARAEREFIVTVLPECSSDDDCGEDEYCDAGECKKKKEAEEECEGGNECLSGMCEEGVCVLCETDADCDATSACSGGYCVPVECPCGHVENHACVPYECCEDPDCESGEFCIGLECVPKELEVLVIEGEAIEGGELLVQVLNNKGEPVPFAEVFTNYMSATADGNGYATIGVPRDGLVFAFLPGYPQAGLMLDVTLLGSFVFEEPVVAGEETIVKVVDTQGEGIPGVRATFDGQEAATDSEGRFTHVFAEPGEVVFRGEKEGYRISEGQVMVTGAPEAACGFPILLNWYWFSFSTLYVLWMLSILLALLNLWLSSRRMLSRRMLKAAAYSLAPLVLALPGIGWFSICFMSNVVALQAIGELAMLVRNSGGKEEGRRRG